MDWLKDLFIDEAKPAIERWYGVGGSGNPDDDIVEEEWIGDGNTHIWISLPEGITSPMLGVGVNGTVTVDWGDGTTPNTLTGTNVNTVRFTPKHSYARPGEYVITLAVDGEMVIFGQSARAYILLREDSSSHTEANSVYLACVRKVEIGNATLIGYHAFQNCRYLTSVKLPGGLTTISDYAFSGCQSLESVTIPDGVTSIGGSAFVNCRSLESVTIPDGVTSIGRGAFSACEFLESVKLPGSLTTLDAYAFNACRSLGSLTIPDGVTILGESTCNGCYALTSVKLLGGLTSIGTGVFAYAVFASSYDFSACTSVPALSSTSAFTGIPADCQIRVPAALYDEWKAATNWATYASRIVAV